MGLNGRECTGLAAQFPRVDAAQRDRHELRSVYRRRKSASLPTEASRVPVWTRTFLEVEEVDVYVGPLVKQPKRGFANQITRCTCPFTPRDIAASGSEDIRQDGGNSGAVRRVADHPIDE